MIRRPVSQPRQRGPQHLKHGFRSRLRAFQPRRRGHQPRRRWSVAALITVGAVATAAALSGGVLALWRSQETIVSASTVVGQVHISVPRVGQASTLDSVAGPSHPATLDMTNAEAVAVAAPSSPGLGIAFDVKLKGDGHTGIDYSLVFPPAPEGSVAEFSQFNLYPRASGDSCDPGTSKPPANAWTVLPGQRVGPFPGPLPDAGSDQAMTVPWCLVVVMDSGGGSLFENTATATGSALGKSVTAQDYWSAWVGGPTDPTADPPYPITVDPLFTRPNTKPRPAPSVTGPG